MYVFFLFFEQQPKFPYDIENILQKVSKPPNEPYIKFFFDLEDTFFGYFDKRERLRDFGTTLSAHLTKSCEDLKKGEFVGISKMVLKLNIGSMVAEIQALEV